MTDTQASSGGTSTDTARMGDATTHVHSPNSAVEAGSVHADAGAPAHPGDTTAVGRVVIPGESTGSTPKFTRPPGMVPPPDSLTVPIQVPPPVVAGRPMAHGVPGVGPQGGQPAIARAAVKVGSASGPAHGQTTTNLSNTGRVTEAMRAARKTVTAAAGRGPRRARLHVKRIDPWSVMKFAFAVSFVLFVVVIVATAVLYLALDAMGVFQSVNRTLVDLLSASGGDTKNNFRITAKGVIGGAALLGLVNVVLFTALATLGAFIYNVCADLVGGIELTLAERE